MRRHQSAARLAGRGGDVWAAEGRHAGAGRRARCAPRAVRRPARRGRRTGRARDAGCGRRRRRRLCPALDPGPLPVLRAGARHRSSDRADRLRAESSGRRTWSSPARVESTRKPPSGRRHSVSHSEHPPAACRALPSGAASSPRGSRPSLNLARSPYPWSSDRSRSRRRWLPGSRRSSASVTVSHD